MDGLLNFDTKKEREDFYIALVVIALFGCFFWWLFCQDSELPSVKNVVPVVAEIEKSDKDGDGIYDEVDKCPEVAGTATNNGCPSDFDGDGIVDVNDKCSNHAGSPKNNGCPSDKDSDGIFDKNDDCPELAGIKANNGCPADSDKDGIYDMNDNCPYRFGRAENGGCPEVTLTEKERSLLERATRAVEFNTGSTVLKTVSQNILNQVAELLIKYPDYNLSIDGHTDNQGDSAANRTLSEGRAHACYEYLVSKGLDSNRLSFEGFGESQPKYSNETVVGRQRNRRVEFKFHY